MPPRCSSTAQQFSPSPMRDQAPEREKQCSDRRPPRPQSSAAKGHGQPRCRHGVPAPFSPQESAPPRANQARAPRGGMRPTRPSRSPLRPQHRAEGRPGCSPRCSPHCSGKVTAGTAAALPRDPAGRGCGANAVQRRAGQHRAPHAAPAHPSPSSPSASLHGVTARLGPALQPRSVPAPRAPAQPSPARGRSSARRTLPEGRPHAGPRDAVTYPFPPPLVASKRSGTSQPRPHSHLKTTTRLRTAAPARRPAAL